MGLLVFPETSVTNDESMLICCSYEDLIYTVAEPEVTQIFVWLCFFNGEIAVLSVLVALSHAPRIHDPFRELEIYATCCTLHCSNERYKASFPFFFLQCLPM
jgi:hypothetical protein